MQAIERFAHAAERLGALIGIAPRLSSFSGPIRGFLHKEVILISYQDDTNYGMLRVVAEDRRNAWQDLDG
jgi:hypothetical protein